MVGHAVGNQKVFNCDGITICAHYVHTTKAAPGNDNCSEDTMSAKLMKADEIARKKKNHNRLGQTNNRQHVVANNCVLHA